MTNIRRALEAAAAVGGAGEYVEDVFSTYVFTANGQTGQTITNGIDLSGEGGLIWHKDRVATYGHVLWDTARGDSVILCSNDTTGNTTKTMTGTGTGQITFNDDGYDLNWDTGNESTHATVGWTFRKAPGFFDVVTWAGNSVSGREIPHNLGSVPGCIMLKITSGADDWLVYHRELDGGTAPEDYVLKLNTTAAEATSSRWNNTAPTSTVFTVDNDTGTNATGSNYVAYLFAHDAQEFGAGADESIIKCGALTTDGSGNGTVSLGWEPQYLLYKNSTGAGNWTVVDNMRGFGVDFNARLSPNTSAAEVSTSPDMFLRTQGIEMVGGDASATIIFIAIRRPMKVPEAGTEVFGVDTRGRLNTDLPGFDTTFPRVDLAIINAISGGSFATSTRLTGTGVVYTNTTAAEGTSSNAKFDYMNGWYSFAGTDADQISWMFNRAPEFFDVVCFTGTGASLNVDHGLTVAPELMLVKGRTVSAWNVYNKTIGATKYLALNTTAAEATSSIAWDDTAPTASVFTVDWGVAGTGDKMIAYLFATLAGISKVGSYTADATLTTIDCGFAAGARYILIKRTDAAGDWYFWDYFRGIVAGNDPYMIINDTAAEVTGTDYIDPDNSGFQITAAGSSTINVDTGEYFFLAIA